LFIGLSLMHLGEFIARNGDYVSAMAAGRAFYAAIFRSAFPRFSRMAAHFRRRSVADAVGYRSARDFVALCAAEFPCDGVFFC
jgi:hypothetical protein